MTEKKQQAIDLESKEIHKKIDALNALFLKLQTPKLSPEIQEEIITSIKHHLFNLIDNFQLYPSYFSQAAQFWDRLPFWIKILSGVAITAPPLVLGLIFQVAILICIGIMLSINYGVAYTLLQNHHSSESFYIENIKTGVSGIIDLFATLSSKLSILIDSLKNQVNELGTENQKLQGHNGQFKNELSGLINRNTYFKQLVSGLDHGNDALIQTNHTLSDEAKTAQEQGVQLKQLIQSYETFYDQLTQSQVDLSALKKTLQNKDQQIGNLRETITRLSQQYKEWMSSSMSPEARQFTNSLSAGEKKSQELVDEVRSMRADLKEGYQALHRGLFESPNKKNNSEENAEKILVLV